MKKLLSLGILIGSCSPMIGVEWETPEESYPNPDAAYCYVGGWDRYKINFGREKIYIRFPSRPLIAQENNLLVGSAADRQVVYKFSGFFPPIGNIDPTPFFSREIAQISVEPFVILGQTISQTSDGDWALDYIVHDSFTNVIIKHRTLITPFNVYTLRAIYPYEQKDRFDDFVESFRIQCQSE